MYQSIHCPKYNGSYYVPPALTLGSLHFAHWVHYCALFLEYEVIVSLHNSALFVFVMETLCFTWFRKQISKYNAVAFYFMH
jgi:hypothetical protein